MVKRLGLSCKLIAVCALVSMLSGIASAQTIGLPTIETVGVGSVVVPADRVIVSIRVETEDVTATAAQEKTRAAIEEIREEIKALDIGEVEFVLHGINVYQQRASVTRPTDTFRTTSGLDVVLRDDTHVGRIIDVALKHGVASIQNVRYHSESLADAAQKALELAVRNAMAKAETITKTTGSRIVMIRQVRDANIVQVINPTDPALAQAGTLQQLQFGLPVQRGEIGVQVEITLLFEVTTSGQQGAAWEEWEGFGF